MQTVPYNIPLCSLQSQGDTFATAYGKMQGTTAFCAVIPIFFSFVPFRYLRRVFPPVVTSSTIMLIGIALTGSGMTNWGGGESDNPLMHGRG